MPHRKVLNARPGDQSYRNDFVQLVENIPNNFPGLNELILANQSGSFRQASVVFEAVSRLPHKVIHGTFAGLD
ncbi:hypothetical protein [Mesorhizobium sp. M0491]|uniref:hypothetical protein n=1 Tax=Mesorhizobium sp. M0491 TaxID=2956950 RepID=UPI0033390E81